MRRILIFLLLVMVAAATGCGKKGADGEESFGPKSGDKPESEAEVATVPEVHPNDKIILEVTVYHPRYVYLTGQSPVTIRAPFDKGFEFEESEYQMNSDHFPMLIPFTVTRKAPRGEVKLKIGMQINYAHKADESMLRRNVLIDVPMNVTAGTPSQRPRTLRIPIEHFLQVDDDQIKEQTQ